MKSRNKQILYLEQWIALFLGIACIAVFLWVLIDGQEAFSSGRYPASAKYIVPAFGWLLTIAVAQIGTTLTRFAFHTPSEEDAETETPPPETQLLDATSNLSFVQAPKQADFPNSEPEVFEPDAGLGGSQRDCHSDFAKLHKAELKNENAQSNQLSMMGINKV